MNLKHIFESTDFVHASGTKEELQVAEFLKSQCEELGVPAHLEGFRVAMGDIEEVHLLADGQEIPCKALSCCGSGVVEGELYYMPGMDPVSLAGAKDKIVLLDQGVGFFSYHDLMKAGAKGLIFQYGNVHYPNTDTPSSHSILHSVPDRNRPLPLYPLPKASPWTVSSFPP